VPQRPPIFVPPGQAIRPQDQRDSSAARGYDRAWRRLRSWFLHRHPLCVRCGLPASLVDHVRALEDGGSRLDAANLQALCRLCHAAKTRTDLAQRRRRRTMELPA
jgi:5-methylcytosine-specific restriction endonuclease McrA